MIAPAHRLERAAADAWRPIIKPAPPDWCERSMRLSADYEASAIGYDLQSRPWWRDVLACYSDPVVSEVVVMAATQTGKTLGLIAGILWCAEHQPAPGLVCLPDQGAAIEFRDRVYADAEASSRRGGFQRITIPSDRMRNTRWIDLGSMRIYLAWSGARQRLRGRACRYVWLSEVDVYRGDKRAGDPVAAADQRVKSFYRSLLYRESSPTEDPSTIGHLEASASDRRRWWCQCPKCGRWQEPRFFPYKTGPAAGRGGFGGLKDDQDNWLEPEEARQAAHYVCIDGCRIDQERKRQFVESGRWVSMGQRIDERGRLVGTAPASRRKVGFHLWSIHSDAMSFGDIAAAHAEARQSGTLREFFGNWLGLPFRSETRIPTWRQLGRRLAWPNRRGEAPAEAWFLTAGCDVQEDRVLYVVRGWAPEVTSWLVAWGQLARDGEDETDLVKSDLRKVEKLLAKRWPVKGKNPLGRSELALKLLNIDSNYRTMDVHAFLNSLPERWVHEEPSRIRAVRGDHRVSPDVRYRLRELDQNTRTGQKYEGGLRQWGIYVYHFYADLAERLAGQPAKPGSWHVTEDAISEGKAYLQQVTNFHRAVELRPDRRRKVVWRPRNNMIPVDYWDCEIYALVAAHMVVGDLGWSNTAWDQWRRRQSAAATERRRAARPSADLAAR